MQPDVLAGLCSSSCVDMTMPCPLAPPLPQLRWWQQPRIATTVGGAANADVEAFWAAARQQPGAVASLCNTSARLANKAVGVGSTVKASLGDHEQFSIAGASSAYKADLCSGHVKVGKRGVALAPEAMAAVRGMG